MDRRDKIGWLFLFVGVGVSVMAFWLSYTFAAKTIPKNDLLAFCAPIVYIWLGVAVLLGFVSGRVKVLVLRAFDDERDDFLVRNVRDVCTEYGRVEAIRQPSRLCNTSMPLPGELGGITASDDRWKEVATKLIRQARIVIIDLSDGSENVSWELEQVRTIAPDRCIVLMDQETATARTPDNWIDERTVIYSRTAPRELQIMLIKRLKELRTPPANADKKWRSLLEKEHADTPQVIQSLDLSRCSNFAPLMLALSYGLWHTVVWCIFVAIPSIHQLTDGHYAIFWAVASMWWIGIVGLFLPRRLLTRADLWTVFSKMGMKSVAHCRAVAGFFILAFVFVFAFVMFHTDSNLN